MSSWLAFFEGALPSFAQGAVVTLELTFGGLFMGLVLGLVAALCRVYGNKVARAVSVGYIELFRGTPLLVQLFLIYYGLPSMGITFSRLVP